MPIIQLKRYTDTYYLSNNPVLKSGEVGVEYVTAGNYYKFKIGDEETPWNSLYYPVVFTKGNNSYSGTQNYQSGILDNANIRNYSESTSFPAISSNVLSLNLSSGNVFRTNLDANITGINILNPRPSGQSHSFSLVLDYGASGRSIVWPSNVLWNGGSGSVPSIGSGVGRSAVLSFFTTDGGVKYFGFLGGNNFGV